MPFGLIGGRLYHVMTDWRTYFGPGGAGSMAALRIWDGGLGIWGRGGARRRRGVDRLAGAAESRCPRSEMRSRRG